MDTTEEGFEVVEGIEEDFVDETDECARDSLVHLIEHLKKVAVNGIETFQDCSDTSRDRIYAVFSRLEHYLQDLEPGVITLFDIAKDYDFNGLRANGYRSCLKILQCCCQRILQISDEISAGKDHLFLSLRSNYRDLESFVACLGQMKSCILHLANLPETAEDGCLFSRMDDSLYTKDADKMFGDLEALNREPFYGRCLGNQFCKSMQNPLKMINVAMASFGESFNKDTIMNKWALSFMSSGKYFMNPELRAQQVVKTTQYSSIDFCKAFWNIAESDLLQELPMIVCPPVQVSHGFEIVPEPLSLPRTDGGGMVDIDLPHSYHGQRAINVRLISHLIREGQEQLLDRSQIKHELHPASPCLIVHCHGGGFVAQSAKSHEVYLRHWARGVGVPILSIDYSLAPESPYPRALEEIFYAYCWAVDNCDLLGSSGSRICFAGDSSGANLMLCACLKAIQTGVRLPDGVLSIYAATYVSYAPSPSRLLAIMDPLLPVGVLTRCLAAYAGFESREVLEHYVRKRKSMNDGWMDPNVVEKLSTDTAEQNTDKAEQNADRAENGHSADPAENGHGWDMVENDSNGQAETTDKNGEIPVTVVNDCSCATNGHVSDQKNHHSNGNPALSNGRLPLSPSNSSDTPSNESFHSATDITPSEPTVRFEIGQSETSYVDRDENESESSLDGFRSLPSQYSSSEAHPRQRSESLVELPRRSSEYMMHKPRSAPPRSNSIVAIHQPVKQEEQRSFNWSSLVSPATKSKIKNNLTTIGNLVWGGGPNHSKRVVDEEGRNVPLHVYRYLPVPDDPLMSPYCASMDTLAKMPPVYLLACHLDPLLDDSIEFAKRLAAAGSEVHLDVFDDLPHGFLNFTLISREAKIGCDTCIVRIRQILLNRA